ncbi:efflux transporter outer membrane subunit [Acinetobacter ursingii]|uniref:efflux transporter outer membrane subunit n=1 Tax=Acinetobacter ursingii TaxID=108980 RepID=UPI0021CD1BBD|nr:efflux transporter outer membrane subunit [Acinetobacter ursingii]MCU4481993.1 efflux transporter outer membrane subunit [Acinetobacter ursingii]MCU4506431.1 efflux transporter outer membrane subunit [Acinetobacter ursingii]MCU4570424.1 efflux transporter outer membrane subunit [Acinetobacter ursingii]
MISSILSKHLPIFSCVLLLVGCSSNIVTHPPAYQQPVIQADMQYKYASLNWVRTQTLTPQTSQWWQLYQDAKLNTLIQQLNTENLTLKQAEARYRNAMALLDEQRSARLPSLGVEGTANRNGSKNNKATSQFSAGIQASWVPDLWGRVAKAVEGQQANLEASQADLAAVKLNQQLLAAQSYWNIRLLDLQLDVLRQTRQSYARSVQILKNQYQAGMIARADVIQAETQLKQVEIQQIERQRERNLQENILAVLLGQTVVQFQLGKQTAQFNVPTIPAQIPSHLLIQRPDVIRTERELAATHAQLGLAQTAWLPDLSIGLNGSLNNNIFSQLFQSPNYLWSIGLNTAATVFDGGKRKAGIDQAQANYDEKLAAYKQTVLTGWKEVEDGLMQSASLKHQASEQAQLLNLAHENERVVTQRYNSGLVSYLEVVTAQNLRLQAEQDRLELQQRQMINSMQLIAALGTGWGRD